MKGSISDRESNIQIAKIFLSNLISSMSGKAFNFALGLMLLDQTRSAMSFGINMIIYPLVSLIFLVPIGNLVDRYPHKWILSLNLLIRIVGYGVFFLLYNEIPNQWILFVVIPFVVLHSITVNVSDTCYSASVHELVNDRKIKRLSSITQTAIALATMLSPAVGVAGYSFFGFSGFILLEILANIFSLGILSFMRFTSVDGVEKVDQEHQSQLESFKEVWGFVNKQRVVVYIILMSMVLNFFYTAVSIGVPFVIKEELFLGNQVIAVLETMAAIGMLLASVSMSLLPDKKEEKNQLTNKISWPLLILDSAIIALGLLFFWGNTAQVVSLFGGGIMAVIAFCLVVLNIRVMTYLQGSIETRFLGRVMSMLFTLNTSVMPIGTLIFTFLFQGQISGGWIFLVSGTVLLLYTLMMLPRILRVLKES